MYPVSGILNSTLKYGITCQLNYHLLTSEVTILLFQKLSFHSIVAMVTSDFDLQASNHFLNTYEIYEIISLFIASLNHQKLFQKLLHNNLYLFLFKHSFKQH